MKKYIGILLAALLAACAFPLLPDAEDEKDTFSPSWELISETTTATVYNAVPAQCNEDCLHTASMFTIVPENISRDRILAMERTMMAEFGLRYGDVVLIEGAGSYDGLWQIQDTMNKRFAGQHKIDFLVPDNIRHGKWKNVKVYRQINREFYAYGL